MGFPRICYDSRFKDAAPVASSTADGFDVLNLRDWRAHTWWQPISMPATVTVDCAEAKAANYCAVWGHDLFSQGATLEVRASTDAFAASDVLIFSHDAQNDDPFLLTWAVASYRYWRARFTGALVPSVAILAIGEALSFPKLTRAGFDPLGRETQKTVNVTVKGNPLGAVVDFRQWSQQIAFANLGKDWLRANWMPAWRQHLETEPFIFAWDAESYFDEIVLGQIPDGKFSAPHKVGPWVDLSFQVDGLVAS